MRIILSLIEILSNLNKIRFLFVSRYLPIYFVLVNNLPVGYEGGKKTRCTDRFVRYPYPKQMYTNYKVHYPRKESLAKNHKEAFNLEKETKIINPHPMELKTTFKEVF